MHKGLFFILLTLWFSLTVFASPPSSPAVREFSFSDSIMWKSLERLRPHPENPYYFSYNGKPVWLNGHSRLWTLNGWMPESHEPLKDRSQNKSRHQSTDMRTYVDEIRDMSQAGVHFIRITPFWPDGWKRGLPMPWLYRKGKKFDLLQWDEDYWKYYRDFMARCAEKNIIVQVEIWDRPGLSHNHESRWKSHPFHPDHNINYGHNVLPGSNAQAQNIVTRKRLFYASVKGKNKKLLKFQEAYVKKLLQETAPFPNIIYCIDNEGTGGIEWESYWAGFIRKKIPDALITAMPLDRVDNTWKSYFEHSDFNCMDGGGSGLRFALEGFSDGGQQGRPGTWASRLDQLYLIRETMAKYRQYMEHYPEKKRPVYVSNSFNNSIDNIWIMFCSGAAGLRYHRILYDEQERMYQQVSHFQKFMREANPDFIHMEPQQMRIRDYGFCLAGDREAVIYFPAGVRVNYFLPVGIKRVRVRLFDTSSGKWVLDEERTPHKPRGASLHPWIELYRQEKKVKGTAAYIEILE